MPPGRQTAVVACMDARLNPYGVLGLSEGDAHVIRNAGGVVTDDVDPLAGDLAAAARHARDHPDPPHRLRHAHVPTTTSSSGRSRTRPGIKPAWAAEAFPRPRRGRSPVGGTDQGEPVHPPHGQRARLRVPRRVGRAARSDVSAVAAGCAARCADRLRHRHRRPDDLAGVVARGSPEAARRRADRARQRPLADAVVPGSARRRARGSPLDWRQTDATRARDVADDVQVPMPPSAPRVLIVDDHARFRALARRTLQADGYEVVGEAPDGAGALAAVAELQPDLVLRRRRAARRQRPRPRPHAARERRRAERRARLDARRRGLRAARGQPRRARLRAQGRAVGRRPAGAAGRIASARWRPNSRTDARRLRVRAARAR